MAISKEQKCWTLSPQLSSQEQNPWRAPFHRTPNEAEKTSVLILPDYAPGSLLRQSVALWTHWLTPHNSLKYSAFALAGVAQLVGHHPTNRKVTGQGTCLAWVQSQLVCLQETTDWCFSLTLMFSSLSPSIPLYPKLINKFKKRNMLLLSLFFR